MEQYIISQNISCHIVMTGNYFKNNHPGGISAVVSNYNDYIENLQYYPTFKEGNILYKLCLFILTYFKLFFKLLFDRRVKIVHIHTAAHRDFKRACFIITLSKFFNKKVFLHSHASQFKDFYLASAPSKKQLIIDYLNAVDVLIVLSLSWKLWFCEIGVKEEKIKVLNNITKKPILVKNQSDIINRPLRFLFLGEIGQRKGVFDLLEVISLHHEEWKDKIELIIGGNKNEKLLQSLIEKYKLEKLVKFVGWVSGAKKIELLNWADIYVLPSYNEGLPISILEAMSYKMPIIATMVGGIPEVVQKNNGVLIHPGNNEELYTAISFYVNNRNLILPHGQESYTIVKSFFPDKVIYDLKELYLKYL